MAIEYGKLLETIDQQCIGEAQQRAAARILVYLNFCCGIELSFTVIYTLLRLNPKPLPLLLQNFLMHLEVSAERIASPVVALLGNCSIKSDYNVMALSCQLGCWVL